MKVYIKGHYGRKKINEKSYLKANDLLMRAFNLVGINMFRGTPNGYKYFDVETNAIRGYQIIEMTQEQLTQLKKNTPSHLLGWIEVEK